MQVGIQGDDGGKWQPWNPTVRLVLREKLNPAPMLAKKVETEIPRTGQAVGFDFFEGDWVAPHGRGRVEDMKVMFTGEYVSRRQYSARLEVVFPNDGDGLQAITSVVEESAFKLPRFAPEIGYQSQLVLRLGRDMDQGFVNNGENHPQNYFIRVRTQKDEDGRIVTAKYGKISGPIGFGGVATKKGTLSLTYYLNPDGTRNLEFDPDKNLFPGERMNAP